MKRDDIDLICNVEGSAPMARVFKKYWLPALKSDDLKADGAPKRLQLLGKTFVAFRDSEGEVGVLDEFCPHRGTSLVLARNENCALQCLYHGWRIDRRGQIIETPAEPGGRNTIGANVHQHSYPTAEVGQIVWVYLGDDANTPPAPRFDFTELPAEQCLVYKSQLQCNWLRGLDGGFDTAHVMYLHADGLRPNWASDSPDVPLGKWQVENAADDVAPHIEVENTPYGLRYAGIRQGAKPDTSYIRTYHFVVPGYAYIPANKGMSSIMAFIPIDNEHTMHWGILFRTDGLPMTDGEREYCLTSVGKRPGIDIDEEGKGLQNSSNLWGQNREAMARRESFSGIAGLWNEDYAVQESMASDTHSGEHLTTSDLALIRVRRILRNLARDMSNGKDSTPTFPEDFDLRRLRANEDVVPNATDWRDVAPWMEVGTLEEVDTDVTAASGRPKSRHALRSDHVNHETADMPLQPVHD